MYNSVRSIECRRQVCDEVKKGQSVTFAIRSLNRYRQKHFMLQTIFIIIFIFIINLILLKNIYIY
jgi:t-SNARE complex subunit (syntaxin)